MRRRIYGRPSATVIMYVLSTPPHSFSCSLIECTSHNAFKRHSGNFAEARRWKNITLIKGEQHLEFKDLAWTLREALKHRGDREDQLWRVAVRLWLEEDINGEVWTISQGRKKPVGFHIQLHDKCMVFDTWG